MRSRSGGSRASRCAWWSTTRARPRASGRSSSEHGLEALAGKPRSGATEGLGVLVGDASTGFQLPALGARCLLTEEEIFGARRRRLQRPRFQRGAVIASFTDLAVNDLVVHESHGVGRYHGLKTLTAQWARVGLPPPRIREAAGSTCRWGGSTGVGVHGGAGARPSWTGSGAPRGGMSRSRCAPRSARWPRSCSALRPARAGPPGRAFAAGAPWSASSRPPSVSRRRRTSRGDRRRAGPTWSASPDGPPGAATSAWQDRVALRAALEAVTEGRQVAVLVPTTVLAQQHLDTFPTASRATRRSSVSRSRTPEGDEGDVRRDRAGARWTW